MNGKESGGLSGEGPSTESSKRSVKSRQGSLWPRLQDGRRKKGILMLMLAESHGSAGCKTRARIPEMILAMAIELWRGVPQVFAHTRHYIARSEWQSEACDSQHAICSKAPEL